MKISIIIPAHNSAEFITKCINSIKSQTFTDYEVIVVCDACEDNTAEVVAPLVDKVLKVNFHNDGMSRNAGIAAAEGEFILFIDSDDWWIGDDAFQIMMDNIGDYDVLAFGFHWGEIGDQGPRCPDGRLYPHVTNKCWRRDFIGGTKFPNVYPDSDRAFHNIIMFKLPEIKEIDNVLYYYDFLSGKTISDNIGRTIETTKRYWGIE